MFLSETKIQTCHEEIVIFPSPINVSLNQINEQKLELNDRSIYFLAIKGSNVRPFVSISLKDKIVRTCTAEGFNPTWNEQLSITVKLV